MKLVYLTANARWAFTFGGDPATASLIAMGDHGRLAFDTRARAVHAAAQQGLKVLNNGDVVADGPNPFSCRAQVENAGNGRRFYLASDTPADR